MKVNIWGLIFLALWGTGCTQMAEAPDMGQETKYYEVPTVEKTELVMGSYARVRLPQKQQHLFNPVFTLFKQYEKKYSAAQPISETSRVNFEKSRKASKGLLHLLKKAQELKELTNGYYSPVVYVDAEQKDNVDALTIQGDLVSIKQGIRLNLGVLVPGFAVDQGVTNLKKRKVKVAILKFGGNLRCIDRCHMEISHPFIPKEGVFVIEFWTIDPDMSLATVTLPQKLEVKYPSDKIVSASVLSKGDATKAGAVADALTRMPLNKAIDFIKLHPESGFILFTQDRRVWISKEIKYMVEDILWPVGKEKLKIQPDQDEEPESNNGPKAEAGLFKEGNPLGLA
ncbi:MAG: FAD:protein FMN transferase [Pseudobdellovibrionaceae bacterium]|nr:MAG: FAD:protein FMN transferase [Pseudobdellovibrionaceae bacterium]